MPCFFLPVFFVLGLLTLPPLPAYAEEAAHDSHHGSVMMGVGYRFILGSDKLQGHNPEATVGALYHANDWLGVGGGMHLGALQAKDPHEAYWSFSGALFGQLHACTETFLCGAAEAEYLPLEKGWAVSLLPLFKLKDSGFSVALRLGYLSAHSHLGALHGPQFGLGLEYEL